MLNPYLLEGLEAAAAKLVKQSFIGAGDPAMTGGAPGAGGPPPGPGGPPMDPAAMGGPPPGPPMDPAAMGGPPPGGPPSPPPGAAGQPPGDMQAMIDAAVQKAMASMGGAGGAGAGAGAGGPGLKPKIDVNVEIAQMKNMMAKLLDHNNIHMPAQQMAITSEDLNNMASQQNSPGQGQAPPSAIPPVEPVQPAVVGGGAGAPGGMPKSGSAAMRDMFDHLDAVSHMLGTRG